MSEQTLAARLKADTAALHETMHVLIGTLAPFAGRDRYVRFVAAQYLFQRRVNALTDHPWLHAAIPDLAQRTRADAAGQDLIDLDEYLSQQCRTWLGEARRSGTRGAPSSGGVAPASETTTTSQTSPLRGDTAPGSDTSAARALGWLYVSEGSTLGAAFLFKEAQTALDLSAEFGAGNLAASPAGRAQAWRAFVSALDAAALSREQADQAVEGAHDAFEFFARTLREAFSDAAPIPSSHGG